MACIPLMSSNFICEGDGKVLSLLEATKAVASPRNSSIFVERKVLLQPAITGTIPGRSTLLPLPT